MKEGEKDISVGTPLIVLVDDEESVPAFSDYSPSETPKAAGPAEKASEDAPASSASADSGEHLIPLHPRQLSPHAMHSIR